MKKLFTFKWLLLSIVLSIAGVNSAWATWYVRGDWNRWGDTNPLSGEGTTLTATINITNDKLGNHGFKMFDSEGTGDSGYWGNTGKIGCNVTDWGFNGDKGGANCTIFMCETGNYTFTFNTSDHTLSVTYPSAQVKVYHKNNDWSGTVYVYRAKDEINSGWPGAQIAETEVIGGVTYKFTYATPGTTIVFNNGESGYGNQTGNLTVTGNAYKYIENAGGDWNGYIPPTASLDGSTWAHLKGMPISIVTSSPKGGDFTNFTYQWQKFIVDKWEDIDGETSSSYSVVSCTTSDKGSYRCKITSAETVGYTDAHVVKFYTLYGHVYGDSDSDLDIDWSNSGTTGTVSVSLDEGKVYFFKVNDEAGNQKYGKSNTVILNGGEKDDFTLGSGSGDYVKLCAGAEGDYVFTFDIAGVGSGNVDLVSVTYPSVTHPAAGYVYFEKPSDWTNVYLYWYTSDGDRLTDWSNAPEITTTEEICGTTYYYTPLGTTYSYVTFKGNGSNQWPGDKVAFSTSGCSKKYLDKTDYASPAWASFNVHTITFAGNSNTGGSMTNIYPACEADRTLAANGFTRTAYTFAGWKTNVALTYVAKGDADDGTHEVDVAIDGIVPDEAKIKSVASDITLTAQWTPNTQTFTATSGSNWNTPANWTDGILPTLEHPVVIDNPVTVNSSETMALAASVTFTGDGTLTIESTGALKVAGTITNSSSSDANKIRVEASGALIFNSTGSTYATVDLSTSAAADEETTRYQYIAIPISYIDVKDAFGGEGIYTYVWSEPKGWERRGYYDGLSAFEAVALTGSSGYTISGALVSTADKEHTLTYTDAATYGETSIKGMNMFGNSWTAPIAVSGITFEGCEKAAHIWLGASNSWDGAVAPDYIPALQAYCVLANSGAGTKKITISYEDAVRALTKANANISLKAPKRTTSDISDHITMYVSGNDLKTRIRLFENEQFSDKMDKGYEAIHIDGAGIAGELYAQAEEKMNVLATDNLEGTIVGFNKGEATNYTISFEGDGRGYYLNDIKTEQSTLIEEGNTYEFTPGEGDNSARFVISKMPMAPTGTETVNDGNKARKQMINGQLLIIRDGRIYGVDGRLVK